MHPEDIKAALKKNGFTIASLSRKAGYKDPQTLKTPFYRHWPKGERIIAKALQKKPEDIWPSRYEAEKKASTIEIPHRSVA